MAEMIIGLLKGLKSYNYAVEAVEEYIPILLEAYAEIDAQIVSDGAVLKDKVDDYVELMGEGYSLEQAKIDLGLDTEIDEPDYEVPSLPTNVYIELPVFNLAIDLKQVGEDFVAIWDAASRKIDGLIENVTWVKTLNDRFDNFLDLIGIPFTENLTYVKPIEVATGQEPDGLWIIDMWFDSIKNDTTDIWMVVGKGEDFTPEVNISVLVIWKAIVYWKMFRIIYKLVDKLGIINLGKKFASKILKLPGLMFSRYSMNKRLRKTAALTTVQVALAMKPEMEVIDGVVDSILSNTDIIKVDIDDISKKFANYSAYG